MKTRAWVSDTLRKAAGQTLLMLHESMSAHVGAEGQEPTWRREAAFPVVQLPKASACGSHCPHSAALERKGPC